MLIQKIDAVPPPAAQAPAGHVVSERARDHAPAAPAPEPAPEVLGSAVARANRAMAALSASVQFVVDPKTGTTVVRIIDTASNEVLRQVPAQEMLEIAQAIDRVQGLLLHTRV